MPVHPVAVIGGELIVNGSQNQIVLVLSEHEAAAAGRRNQLGYTVHGRVCRKSRLPDAVSDSSTIDAEGVPQSPM